MQCEHVAGLYQQACLLQIVNFGIKLDSDTLSFGFMYIFTCYLLFVTPTAKSPVLQKYNITSGIEICLTLPLSSRY